MSSWQQQDAQEYFSKVMDELDNDAAKTAAAEKTQTGLEAAVLDQADPASVRSTTVDDGALSTSQRRPSSNPLEGLITQKVVCTRCGYSEGLSMIPFNCLTLPLGLDITYDLEDCLDEYTKGEDINDVDCAKCTLLSVEEQIKKMLPPDTAPPTPSDAEDPTNVPSTLSLPSEMRALVAKRLQAIQDALELDDFSDKTLNETCSIPKRAHISSTKTRQAVIGRAPRSLAVHINRSVFDEMTGVQRKNYAKVRYPIVLNLEPWMLGTEPSEQSASSSMLGGDARGGKTAYRLKAVVTHYGRHENGHYICYRQHPATNYDHEDDEVVEKTLQKWWRLSDEVVTPVSEEDVLAQGGVFMLFYDREESQSQPPAPVATASAMEDLPANSESTTTTHLSARLVEDAAAIPLPSDLDEELVVTPAPAPVPDSFPSSDPTIEDDSEADTEPPPSLPVPPKSPPPQVMRTSRGRQSSRQGSRGEAGFGGGVLRAVGVT